MIDLSLEVRNGTFAHLANNAEIIASVKDSIFDELPDPDKIKWPYIKLGAPSAISWEATCFDGTENRIAIHGFARGTDAAGTDAKTQALKLLKTIVSAMDSLDIIGLSVMDYQLVNTNIFADTATRGAYHAVAEFSLTVAV